MKSISTLLIVLLISLGATYYLYLERSKDSFTLSDALKFEYNIFQLDYTLKMYSGMIGDNDALVHVKVDDTDTLAKIHQDSLMDELKAVVKASELLRADLEKLHRVVEKSKKDEEEKQRTIKRLGANNITISLSQNHNIAQQWKSYESMIASKVSNEALEKLKLLSFSTSKIKIEFDDDKMIERHTKVVQHLHIEEFDLYIQLIRRRVMLTELIAIEAISAIG